ncbi:hypothetical protein CDCA_CDCA10G2874 [Cyanidium caldarium]|uniref:Triosephosphate isomerase n=1 Tax=Cyanidium caldarium TaxID=2771 RepID=A0AAV9IX49_CYACA|nr:hypothetical protein CDCA_CDCA10G2874 [Cyanidium caldarium]
MTRKYLVGGNWKCNGSLASVKQLCSALNAGDKLDDAKVEVVCAPPAPYVLYARNLLRPDFMLALQNCWVGGCGAYTGEVAADMVADCLAPTPWVILGHSERRHLPELRESDETVAKKTKYAVEKGLQVILCIGELLEEREANRTQEVNERQLEAVRAVLSPDAWDRIVIAYEPVWAIGTGKVATPEQAQETHAAVRQWLIAKVGRQTADNMRILYGGSVKGSNAAELACKPDVDGFLVGGASLKGDEFLQIIAACQNAAS